MDTQELRDYLAINYLELEEMNVKAQIDRESGLTEKEFEDRYVKYLEKESKVKAVTICFSDIEGRLHMLDYNKKYFLDAYDNLTFDGSSIRGFSELVESDLRLSVDWSSLVWLPADIFGAGKVLMFSTIADHEGNPYESDYRSVLKILLKDLKQKEGYSVNIATETEGFLVEGTDSEQNYSEGKGFKLISSGGYYHSLPQDKLRLFIDKVAETQRSMGFNNEKDHPEVAPSQFELNYSYTDALAAADKVLLYKLVCRQVADKMGMTATFLPKPITGINGSGMHTNISISKNQKNIFFDPKGEHSLSKFAWGFIDKVLGSAPDISLILNSSVNAYRRLDPNFEAPNQIKVSAKDRGSMIRIPIGNEKTARIEVRSISPDANPYLTFYALIKAGLEGTKDETDIEKRERVRFLPSNIHVAINTFRRSKFIDKIMGESNKRKYVDLKQVAANRSPIELGGKVKLGEVMFHHEVTNQVLWNDF